MKIAYFGSGEFGLPTLQSLVHTCEVVLVVTQPDKPAGRKRVLTPTPIGAFAQAQGLALFKPDDPNVPDSLTRIREHACDASVVIAYGHKLKPPLLEGRDAINLHASLLPKYRGAAPINWAIIAGERETGVSVIHLAQRMDAGGVLLQRSVTIDDEETAGELHDRLALLGPEAIGTTLSALRSHSTRVMTQDESLATRAPKLVKADGLLDFSQAARVVQRRIHGLTPWPGCWVRVGGKTVRLHRARCMMVDHQIRAAMPGTLTASHDIRCGDAHPADQHAGVVLRPLEVQPANGTLMSYEAFARGHTLHAGMTVEPIVP